MATRRAVAASIASAVIFSSLLISNYVLFSGAAQNFSMASLAAEERDYRDQALIIRSVALLDLLDGAQEILSSGHFVCSNASYSFARSISAERVHVGWGGLTADASLLPAPDHTTTDNLTALQPFSGSIRGWANTESTSIVQGISPDGSLTYSKSEEHLLSLPLRLSELTAHCLDASASVSSTLHALGGQFCNSSLLVGAVTSVANEVSVSASSDGFEVFVSYSIVSVQPCRVAYWISAQQSNVLGPEGIFTFTESETGYVVA